MGSYDVCIVTNTKNNQTFLLDQLLQMSEEEFDLFLDLIDYEKNKNLLTFASWVQSVRKRNALTYFSCDTSCDTLRKI